MLSAVVRLLICNVQALKIRLTGFFFVFLRSKVMKPGWLFRVPSSILSGIQPNPFQGCWPTHCSGFYDVLEFAETGFGQGWQEPPAPPSRIWAACLFSSSLKCLVQWKHILWCVLKSMSQSLGKLEF